VDVLEEVRTRWRYIRRHQRSPFAAISPFLDIAEPAIHAIKDVAARFGLSLMLKGKTLAYDRCGNFIPRDLSHTQNALKHFSARAHCTRRNGRHLSRGVAVTVMRTAWG
jgi:phosphoribosylaminoimidazole carboxylase (NCAIR synthetase)